jgi:hypoxanthine phosphoribosyltransferase
MAAITELISQQQIADRVAAMGKEISQEIKNWEHPVIIGVLKGALVFMSDLIRQIKVNRPVQVEFVRLSSYGSATESSGEIQAPYLELPNLFQRNILVIEDIIDSGRTANFFFTYLKEQFQPSALKLAVFLDKPQRRVIPIKPDYAGFVIEDIFVIGYGLDFNEEYRELPYLGQLSSHPSS